MGDRRIGIGWQQATGYAGDFGGRQGVLAFLARHLPAGEARDWLHAQGTRLRLAAQPYDWGLNRAL